MCLILLVCWFPYVSSGLHSWDPSHLVMVSNHFLCSCVWGISLIEAFYSCVHTGHPWSPCEGLALSWRLTSEGGFGFWHYFLDTHMHLGFSVGLIANSVSCCSITLGFSSLSLLSTLLCVWHLLPYWCLWWCFFLCFDFLLETLSLCCLSLPWAFSLPASAFWVGVTAMHYLAGQPQTSSSGIGSMELWASQ